jgi:hypothetical protein
MSGDTADVTDLVGTGNNLIWDAATLLNIQSGGSISGFDGDTLPKTIYLGGGSF